MTPHETATTIGKALWPYIHADGDATRAAAVLGAVAMHAIEPLPFLPERLRALADLYRQDGFDRPLSDIADDLEYALTPTETWQENVGGMGEIP